MRMRDHAQKKVRGKVTGITSFGAFIRLEDGRSGLVHISQVADVYVSDVHDFLTVGQEVEPTVLSCDEKGRLAFSLKTDTHGQSNLSQPAVFRKGTPPTDFEDMLSRYKQNSEDRLGNLCKTHACRKRKNRI